MNREQFLDAVGQTDEQLLSETEQLRKASSAGSTVSYRSAETRRPIRRRVVFVLAACLVLAMGAVAAYASGVFRRSGSTSTGTDDEGNELLFFVPDEDMRLPVSSFAGEVRNSTTYMYEYWQRSQGVEFPYPDPRDAQDGFHLPDTKDVPYMHAVAFASTAEAAAYIGYSSLKLPAFVADAAPRYLYVCSMGDDHEFMIGDKTEPDFQLAWIQLHSEYDMNGIKVISNIYLITEHFINRRAIYASGSQGTDGITLSTEVVNDREFQVADYGPSVYALSAGNIEKEIIWAEDKVEYHLNISYPESQEEEANRIIADWMNGF
ncbi:MAG: hypothetical protein J5643_08710 [Lachnospiraceae bacterium]|nr:hypothetical protein [Lachnospiraceae bacterium]